jgi:hypothetical protein
MTVSLMILSLVAAPAWATPVSYDLSVKLVRDGRSSNAPHLTVAEGESRDLSTVPGEFIEVRVTEGAAPEHRGIYLEFVVGTKSVDGRRLVMSRPRLRAVENEPTTITVGDGGRSTLFLSTVARRHTAIR